jgi:predicted acetyltransferase
MFLYFIIEQLAKFGEKIDTLTQVVIAMRDELKDLKEIKESQKSHDFLMVRIFDILYI